MGNYSSKKSSEKKSADKKKSKQTAVVGSSFPSVSVSPPEAPAQDVGHVLTNRAVQDAISRGNVCFSFIRFAVTVNYNC